MGTFVRCVENALHAFGGSVDVVVLDNLKSGITQACFYDPGVNTVFAALARHYGFAVLPIRPRTPRHNGKVERIHQYADSSALRARRFESLEDQNRHLVWWNQNVARLRIHGTTKQQVWARFDLDERPKLRPLPAERFQFFRSGTRSVSPDGHIEVERAFYSVPSRYLGHQLRVDWDDRIVRIYHQNESIAVHPRTEAGRFQTTPEHLPEQKRYVHVRLESHLLAKAAAVGPDVRAWAEKAIEVRGVLAYRLLHGVLGLTRKHPGSVVNRACQIALQHSAFRYRTLVTLCNRQPPEQRSLFTQQHELIRPVSEYQQLFQQGVLDDFI